MGHQGISAAALSTREAYQLLTDLVAPRPVAWVSSCGRDGSHNLAPFSYYQALCSRPPMVCLSISWRPDGRPKDTLRNILDTGGFVIHHVDRNHAEAMNLTSADLPPHHSEWDLVAGASHHLTPVPAQTVSARRIEQAKAALECQMTQAIPLGRGAPGGPSCTLVIAEVGWIWLADELVRRDEQGRLCALDPALLATVGRLGGIAYTDTTGRFSLPRPTPGGLLP